MNAYRRFLDRHIPGSHWIPMSQVDLSPRWWHLKADSLESAVSLRAREIRQDPSRLNMPVLLRAIGPGEFDVILGLTQVLAAREIGYQSVGARVAAIDEFAGAQLALEACASHWHSSYLRKAWLLARILNHADVSLSGLAGRLSTVSPATLSNYHRCAQALPEDDLMRWSSRHRIPADRLLNIPKRELDPAIRARSAEQRAYVLAALAQRLGGSGRTERWWDRMIARFAPSPEPIA